MARGDRCQQGGGASDKHGRRGKSAIKEVLVSIVLEQSIAILSATRGHHRARNTQYAGAYTERAWSVIVSASRGHSYCTRCIAIHIASNMLVLRDMSVYLLRATQAHVGPLLRLAT